MKNLKLTDTQAELLYDSFEVFDQCKELDWMWDDLTAREQNSYYHLRNKIDKLARGKK